MHSVKLRFFFKIYYSRNFTSQNLMAVTNHTEELYVASDPKIKAFFDSAPPLQNAADIKAQLNEFIQRNCSSSGKHTFTQF